MTRARPRRPSPCGGRRPTKADLDALRADSHDGVHRVGGDGTVGVDDVMPADVSAIRLLIVGVNPGLWTAAVNAPFAHPGNRFWPSLHRAGITDELLDVTRGLSQEQADGLVRRGLAMTNLVSRPTARADELDRDELRAGARRTLALACRLHPRAVVVVGITAFRVAFHRPKAKLGIQDISDMPDWPKDTALWVLPQPSGLNAHETVNSLAEKWREVWESV
ncbi:mismatch-specific DNA-glycosylase [uncultured Bifidobacterium sp.]|uniref:mismatch-specific DNA-glycosylase n=1 Tax=uncultured Bifidobacterium sp. TaxID=165187 RepID=UPI0026119E5D|nr:mismatch-specific DNA-glycosylase [uncultured Bifidobacterium sp.]